MTRFCGRPILRCKSRFGGEDRVETYASRFLLCHPGFRGAQRTRSLQPGTDAHAPEQQHHALLIAVSPVDQNIVWAVGTNSTFVVTTDGGNTWRTGVVPTQNSGDIQLRDVQAVSEQIAYVHGDRKSSPAISPSTRPQTADTPGRSSSRTSWSALSTTAWPSGLPRTASRIAIR